MLPFSLAVIVIIIALCQEISLEPHKKQLNAAFERYEQRKNNNQNLLPPPSQINKPAKYHVSKSSIPLTVSSTPKFPR